ncbi:MAG TPA: pyridoxal-phosphate dependent enzyme, partial [Micromonosporaceae bacterium]
MFEAPNERVRLATWPTPLEPAPRLAEAIGLAADRLWIKRDDLTGLGAGGNKIRKLEFTVAAALAERADTLVTTGAPQSNHARLTAAAAARTGLDAVLVMPGRPPGTAAGNLILDGLFGARTVWASGRALDVVALEVAEQLREQGRRPAVIPFGGSSATGAHGYRLAAHEISQQLPDFNVVVCAVGSGGTMAGLVAGLGARRVFGVHCGAVDDPHAAVLRLLDELGSPDRDLRIRTDQVGVGYDALTPGAADAMELAARREGLVLDPIDTGRALAGL